MSVYSLETDELTHQFTEKEIVVNCINLRVKEGSIYGFLGPNGAGKTTTLRLVLGLLRKQKGTIRFFGMSFQQNRISILRKIGSLIESPSLYGHLTAYENLNLLRKIYQCPKERINYVLHIVGLSACGKKVTSQFSLGMKQRLSIAISLLHNPRLLILDEPTNGLDPNGIIEMRELLKMLNREQGITIIISSHLLAEIERLVTHIGIIHKGKMVFQGGLNELSCMQHQSSFTMFDTSDLNKTLNVLGQHNIKSEIKDGRVLVQSMSRNEIANINQQLVSNDVGVFEISIIKNDLETIFMDLINTKE